MWINHRLTISALLLFIFLCVFIAWAFSSSFKDFITAGFGIIVEKQELFHAVDVVYADYVLILF